MKQPAKKNIGVRTKRGQNSMKAQSQPKNQYGKPVKNIMGSDKKWPKTMKEQG